MTNAELIADPVGAIASGDLTLDNYHCVPGIDKAEFLRLQQLLEVAKDDMLFTVDGGGGVISVAAKGGRPACFNAEITGWTIVAPNESGDIQIDVWKKNAAIPTDAESITDGNEPSMAGSQVATGSVADWSDNQIVEGDVVLVNVDSVATLTNAVLALHVRKFFTPITL